MRSSPEDCSFRLKGVLRDVFVYCLAVFAQRIERKLNAIASKVVPGPVPMVPIRLMVVSVYDGHPYD